MGGGLVGHQDLGVVHQGSGDGHPLLLASGQRSDLELPPVTEVQIGEDSVGPLGHLREAHGHRIERKHHVLQHRQIPDQIELLEDETEEPAADRGQRGLGELGHVSVSHHDPARGRPGHAPHQAQKRGLARPARALEHHDLAPVHRHGHAVHGPHLVGPTRVVDLGQRLGPDQGLGRAGHPLITSSGSVTAVFHDGIRVLAM